jgi:glycosyltransferase involved in cell wall biosynthesis
LITTPGDADELAQAVVLLANDAVLRKALGERAREYAVTNLERDAVLEKLEVDLRGCYRHV